MKKLLPCLLLLPLLLASLAPAQPPAKPAPAKHGRGFKPMSAEEFKKLHAQNVKRHGYPIDRLVKTVTPPAVFDCVTLGIVGPVVDQGQCGDCYGVSSSDACTAAFLKAGWGKADGSFKISDQYGLDCGAYQGGCNGGDEAQVIDVMKTKGFPAEKWVDLSTGTAHTDYGPYTGSAGSCQLKSGAKMWQLQDWGYVAGDQGQGAATLDQIKAALMTYGTLSIALDASSFDSYSGGVINNLGTSVDHAITMVGWDDTKKAVHCRNNWGTSWGEQGYCWISYTAVPQIVEPIWLLAASATPVPPVPPSPVPPTPPGPTPPTPPPGPTPPNPAAVGITLTPDQVASVNSQSNAVVVSGGMTLQQLADLVNSQNGSVVANKGMTLKDLMEALDKSKAAPVPKSATPCPCQTPEPPKSDPAVERMMAEVQEMKRQRQMNDADFRRALSAVLDALLKEEKK